MNALSLLNGAAMREGISPNLKPVRFKAIYPVQPADSQAIPTLVGPRRGLAPDRASAYRLKRSSSLTVRVPSVTFGEAPLELQPGDKAPKFKLATDGGGSVSTADL